MHGLSDQFQHVIKAVKLWCGDNYINKTLSLNYCRKLINSVNERGYGHEIPTRNFLRGLLKVSILRNSRSMQSCPSISWVMFHKMSEMPRDLKHQDTLQASLEIQNLNSLECSSPPHQYQPSELNLPGSIQEVPSDLKYIQPLSYQVWYCNDIGFDLNEKWRKILFTYKFFTGERVWRNQTGERSPFLCTALIFSHACGHSFLSATLKISITTYPVIW